MMKLSNEYQKFVAKLSEIAFDDRLEETVSVHSQELMTEMRRLVGDDESQSSRLLDQVEYGFVEDEFPWGKDQSFGLKIKGTNILLSEAMHAFEDEISASLPQKFNEYYPELTHEQWKSVIRMAIDVMTCLDRHVLPRPLTGL